MTCRDCTRWRKTAGRRLIDDMRQGHCSVDWAAVVYLAAMERAHERHGGAS